MDGVQRGKRTSVPDREDRNDYTNACVHTQDLLPVKEEDEV